MLRRLILKEGYCIQLTTGEQLRMRLHRLAVPEQRPWLMGMIVQGITVMMLDRAKTQVDGGAKGLLDCGARGFLQLHPRSVVIVPPGFDWRPTMQNDGDIIMHHGDIDINHKMSDSLDEVPQWFRSCAALLFT